ncbi:hypothetical protein QL285_046190 [Trifolium repens]|nr:hypothetical protein QL285_046190 [Trifolium repens]
MLQLANTSPLWMSHTSTHSKPLTSHASKPFIHFSKLQKSASKPSLLSLIHEQQQQQTSKVSIPTLLTCHKPPRLLISYQNSHLHMLENMSAISESNLAESHMNN